MAAKLELGTEVGWSHLYWTHPDSAKSKSQLHNILKSPENVSYFGSNLEQCASNFKLHLTLRLNECVRGEIRGSKSYFVIDYD